MELKDKEYVREEQIYREKGLAYFNLGQYNNAIAEFTKAIAYIKETQGTIRILRRRGNAYYQLQQYERAIEDYNRAISLAPRDALNYESRAALYRQLSNFSLAERDLAKANNLYEQYYEQDKTAKNSYRYNTYCEIPPL